MTTTAPDPPGVDDPTLSLRRLSTTCSTDPPETMTMMTTTTRPTGLDPVECQTSSSSSNLKSSITSRREDFGEAMVLYEPPTSPGASSNQDTDEEKTAKDPPKDDISPGAGDLVKVDSPGASPGAGALVKSDPKDNGREMVTKPPPVEDMRRGFDHCFVTVPFKDRLSVLFATLRRSSERKVVVICSTWESSKFHAILFRQLEMLHVYELHENMEGHDVARAFDEFVYQYPGILFASEIAMREFDIPPNVDYIIQYEPPMNPTEYVFRHSNAKIYRTSCHKALLFLTPDEMDFLKYFEKNQNKELEARKVSEFQGSAEKLVAKHSELNDYAWKAFRAFMIAYESHSHSDIYDEAKIDESGVRRSFGQPHLPEYSSKYFAYSNQGAVEKKKEDEEEGGDDQQSQQKPQQWVNDKSWRKKSAPHEWMAKDKKSWKHTHTNSKG